MQNIGKQFENDFRFSIPRNIYCLKIPDPAIGFNHRDNSNIRFAPKPPFDFILCNKGQLYCFELKSTKYDSLSYGTASNSVIKERQLKALLSAASSGAITGLIINFRNKNKTYYIESSVFYDYISTSPKKSINYSEIQKIGILIPQKIKKINWKYDLSPIFENQISS